MKFGRMRRSKQESHYTISTLQNTLGETKNRNFNIETAPKVGYRFIAGIEYVASQK